MFFEIVVTLTDIPESQRVLHVAIDLARSCARTSAELPKHSRQAANCCWRVPDIIVS
jgi:hypothetical protein